MEATENDQSVVRMWRMETRTPLLTSFKEGLFFTPGDTSWAGGMVLQFGTQVSPGANKASEWMKWALVSHFASW